MSVSFSLIKKRNKKEKFVVNKIIEKYFEALTASYTMLELDGGFAYRKNLGCLSFLIDCKYPNFKDGDCFSEKKYVLANKSIYAYKIVHKNSDVSRNEVLKILSDWGKISSDFIIMEQTGMRSSIDMRPPWTTKKGNIFFSVGLIGHYFEKLLQPKYYPNIDQGVKFMDERLTKKLVKQEIINEFYSQLIDTRDIFLRFKETGLMHFTIALKEVSGQLKVNFIQGNYNIVRYFFNPDVVFCSDEPLLRAFRHIYYSKIDTVIKKSLEKMEISLS